MCACWSAKTVTPPLSVCVCVLSGARQMWAVRPHCLHTTPWCDLGGCRWPWLAASYQLIKPLTWGHSASRHTLHLFHNTRTQSHTLVRGAPQVWQAATCSTHTHTHTHTHTSQFVSSRRSVWPRWPDWTLAHPHWFITPHVLAPRCLLAGGASLRVMTYRRRAEEKNMRWKNLNGCE